MDLGLATAPENARSSGDGDFDFETTDNCLLGDWTEAAERRDCGPILLLRSSTLRIAWMPIKDEVGTFDGCSGGVDGYEWTKVSRVG